MDFWDLTKLLVRRWKIASPMLVLSVALAVLTITQVDPDYFATAYVQLVPPVSGDTKPGETTADQRNPWIGQGLQTIGNAAIVTVTDRSVEEQMKEFGYSDSYTLIMGSTSPMVSFEVVGNSEQQARATAEQLVGRFSQSVANLQSAYGISPQDAITARRLDRDSNVERSNSKLKRAFVAVLGAGLLLSAAGTVGIDAWLRRRQRRRSAVEGLPSSATVNQAIPLAQRQDERDKAEQPPVKVADQPTLIPVTAEPSGGKGNGREEQSHQPNPSESTIVLPKTRQ